jgi:hypothetical protein
MNDYRPKTFRDKTCLMSVDNTICSAVIALPRPAILASTTAVLDVVDVVHQAGLALPENVQDRRTGAIRIGCQMDLLAPVLHFFLIVA